VISEVSPPLARFSRAGIALAPDSEAALHTRMMCGKSLMEISGVIPQATPSPPPPRPDERPVDGREPD